MRMTLSLLTSSTEFEQIFEYVTVWSIVSTRTNLLRRNDPCSSTGTNAFGKPWILLPSPWNQELPRTTVNNGVSHRSTIQLQQTTAKNGSQSGDDALTLEVSPSQEINEDDNENEDDDQIQN